METDFDQRNLTGAETAPPPSVVLPEPERVIRVLTMTGALLFFSFGLGVAALILPPEYLFGGVIALLCGVVILLNPYAGLIIYLAVVYLRPGSFMPSLNALHIYRLLSMALAASLLFRWIQGKERRFVKDRMNLPLFLFPVVGLLSMTSAAWLGAAADALEGVLVNLVTYLLIINLVDTPKRFHGFLWAFLLFNALLCVLQVRSYMEMQASPESYRFGSEAGGFLGNANDFALAELIAVPFALAVLFGGYSRGLKTLAAICLIIFLTSIMLTFSRGAFIGLCALMIVTWKKLPRKGLTLALFGILLALLWTLAPSSYRERIRSITTYKTDESAVHRLEIWKLGARIFLRRPLAGVGLGNYETAMGRDPDAPRILAWRSAHNLYIQLATELGVLGIFIYSWAIFLIFKTNAQTRRRLSQTGGERAWISPMSHGIDSGLIAYLATSLFLSTLTYPYVYLLAALAVSLSRVSARLAPASEPAVAKQGVGNDA